MLVLFILSKGGSMYELQIEDEDGKHINVNIEDIQEIETELDKHSQYKSVRVRRLVKDESSGKENKSFHTN